MPALMDVVPFDAEAHVSASFRRAGEHVDLYRIWTDGPILRIEAKGSWDLPAAEAYIRDITRIIGELRTQRPCLRVIVDRSDTPTFQDGVSEPLIATYRAILRAGDRIAITVDSSLAKGHLRKIADREETQMFLSISAARTWVLAYG